MSDLRDALRHYSDEKLAELIDGVLISQRSFTALLHTALAEKAHRNLRVTRDTETDCY